MAISPQDIGKRLKQVRKYYNLTQNFVAESVGLPQNSVSRLECGRELSSEKLILFLEFYSKYIKIDIIFDERFDILLTDDLKISKRQYIDSILEEKLKMLQEFIENNNNVINQELNNLIYLAKKTSK
jgi:transcriptional regulator with XRE-family HTH domain